MYIRHILPEPELGVMPLNPSGAALTGVVNGVLQLALQQAANGHRVEIFCPTEAPQATEMTLEKVQIYWIPIWKRFRHPRYDFRYLAPLIRRTMLSSHVHITHVHDNPYLLLYYGSKRAVSHHHGLVLRGSSMYDRMEQRAGRVICISEHIRGEILGQVQGVAADKVVTIHDGIHLREFTQSDRAAARAVYDLRDDQLAILFAGRVSPEKGVHTLLEAFRKIYEAGNHQLVLLIAGSTQLGYSTYTPLDKIRPDLSPYEQKVQDFSAGLPVRFIGNVNSRQISTFYRAGDLFVAPSTWQEPFGRINIEAMAAGLPVIASAVGGIPEVVKHESNGLLVPPNDVDALTQALTRLIQDEALRHQMIANGQTFVRKFDWATITKQVDEVYEAL